MPTIGKRRPCVTSSSSPRRRPDRSPASASSPRGTRPSRSTKRRQTNSSGSRPKTKNAFRPPNWLAKSFSFAVAATPETSATRLAMLSGRSERLKSETSAWKSPKSARPTWISSSALFFTPVASERSATIRPTPRATPVAVSAVRAGRRSRFRQTSDTQVTNSHIATLSAGMEPNRDEILRALERVIDPELRRPVTELDMVRDIEIDGGDVRVTIALTVAGCPLRDSFKEQVAEVLRDVPGVERVALGFDVMTAEERQALTTKLRGGMQERSKGLSLDASTRVLAVCSGQGGVGKSTLAANLAVALAQQGKQVGILDADVYGHSVPHVLGIHQKPVLVDKMIVPPVKHDLKLMSIGFFLDDNQPVMWRGPMLHRALEQFLSDVHWGPLDVLIVDMPPGTGDVAISLGQLLPRAETIVVTTPQPAAQEVAARAALMAQKTSMRLLGVIENMSGEVFGSGGGDRLAEELGVQLLGRIPLDPRVREAGDAGEPLVTAEIASIAERIGELRPGGIVKPLTVVS